MMEEEEAVEESPTEKNAAEMVEEEEAIEEENVEKMVEEEAMEEEAVEAEEAEEEADKVVEKEAETVFEEEGENYTDEEKQLWALVVYKASEEMADGTNEVRRDGTSEVRTGFKLRCKQKIMMYGKPRKVTAKKRRIPSNESALVIAYTPREKRKPQWLQSPYTQMKTEDIDRPKKKRKTKAK